MTAVQISVYFFLFFGFFGIARSRMNVRLREITHRRYFSRFVHVAVVTIFPQSIHAVHSVRVNECGIVWHA